MSQHRLYFRHEFFGSVIYDSYHKDYYFFDQDATDALLRIYAGEKDEELDEFYKELEENDLVSSDVKILHNEKPSALSAPLKVFLDITYRCNLHCAHCFTNSYTPHPDELSTTQIYSLIDQMEACGTGMLAIAGGEPLLRPDFFDVVEYATGKGVKVGMTTNGLLITPAVAERLHGLHVSSIAVSLDGMEQSHDSVRGKGTWKHVVENIKILRQYCRSAKVGIRYTINALNLIDYEPVLRLAEEIGLDIVKFNPIRSFGRAVHHPHLLISQKQYVQFLTSVQQAKTSACYSLPKTPLDSCEYEFIDLGFGCTGGHETCNVTPTGEFSGCAFLGDSFVVGNIQESSFLDLWHKAQDSVHCQGNNTCRSCAHYGNCRAGCRSRALFEFGNINAIDPHCAIGRVATGEKLTIREEGESEYVVYDCAKERYKKFDSFSSIEKEYPVLVSNQQYRLISSPCNLPLKIFFDVTSGCNSRCIHCYNNSHLPLQDELTTDEIRELARQLHTWGIYQVSIAGGEPFLRKDIFDILSIFCQFNVQASVTTNGLLLTQQNAKKLAAAHVKHITISIDGITREQYQEIRGVDGFDLLNENIRLIRDHFSGVLAMRLSVMKGNTDPQQVIQFAESRGFTTLKVNKTHLLGRFVDHQEYCISDEEYEQIIDSFAALQSTTSLSLELPREKYLNANSTFPCSAGKKTISISSQGSVFPCAFGPETFCFGSLREKPLIDILLENKDFSVDNVFCHTCPGMKSSRHITKSALLT
jgi:radical SAM protein with 4Fe4S-binding SPASM domain